ncbi:winged helix-turn-helix transcriptional regulator (plasmid) [Streptomyces sp. NBC_00637]|uniref:winged helix-turn-helix transcriptional regulator n=1 Tax=Streptomyces sp. NBC_00637 TaxID=2903667 RepID=UPI002F90F95B
MTVKEYGQFCGLARAMEMVGERWTLLIVRDLLVGPKRYTDLRNGLPNIPTNMLATRLKQLEAHGVVARRALPHPDRGVVYELTDYGRELQPAVIALGRWGAQTMTEPRTGEIATTDSRALSFHTAFHPEATCGAAIGYEVRMSDATFSLSIEAGRLTVETGSHPDPDLVIEGQAGRPVLDIMRGSLAPADAVAEGRVRIEGPPALLDRFVEIFHL